MKLDYKFIKEILLTMEEYDNCAMENFSLIKKLNITNKILEKKFVAHILVMTDLGLIKSTNPNEHVPMGLLINHDESIDIRNSCYRLTAQGYEFLDALKKDNIFNQLVDLALPTALKIGTQLLTQTIWEKIKSGSL